MNSKAIQKALRVVLMLTPLTALGQNAAPAKDPSKEIPVLDGGIGPCSADLTVTDAAGAPVYAAKVKVHIAYGFMNAASSISSSAPTQMAAPASPVSPTESNTASTFAHRRATAAAKHSTIPLTHVKRDSRSNYRRTKIPSPLRSDGFGNVQKR